VETVAIYSERPIKTYGLKVEHGLVLVTGQGRLADLVALQSSLAGVDPPPRVIHTSAWPEDDTWSISLCLAHDQLPALLAVLERAGLELSREPVPVGLIHLQGPHFGDRYGIVSQALEGLRQVAVAPLGLGAVVHSLFMLFEPAQCPTALEALAEYFSSP